MKIVMIVDYKETDMTSYEISDWITETFGEKEIKDDFEEIRDSRGYLTHIKFSVKIGD